MYSYKIHRIAAKYLRDIIEPELSSLCGLSVDQEWESYYKKSNVPGIRQGFFLLITFIITVISLIYLWSLNKVNCLVLTFATIIYVVFIIILFVYYIKGYQTNK